MPALTLEFRLDPADARRLIMLAGGGRARTAPTSIVWHDAPQGALAAQGLSLAERSVGRAASWLLERICPAPAEFWPPGAPPQLIRVGASLAELAGSAGPELPGSLRAMARFIGTMRTLPEREGVQVSILSGELRSLTAARSACRATLAGEVDAVARLAMLMARDSTLSIPPASLCAEGLALAGMQTGARRLGAPRLPAGCSADEAFAHIIAHLLDVILHHAARVERCGSDEPVHQMRVALRRLRSAFGLFRDATTCEPVEATRRELRAFAAVLGPARDWDVFTRETCARALAVLPGETALARLAAQAERRRGDAYQALTRQLAGPSFRALGLQLTLLAAMRPWREAAGDEAATADLATLAARVLSKRLKRVLAAGEDVSELPAEALHAIRLNGKRLRYAAEFFAPLFPHRGARPFLKRMTQLQQRLGQLNDGSVAGALMSQIGHGRSYAAGLVHGLVAADGAETRAEVARSWRQFRKQDPFWT